jgi:2'-5' RNA ligase
MRIVQSCEYGSFRMAGREFREGGQSDPNLLHTGPMSPLPAQLSSHWWQRPGRTPGRELYHWHLLFHDQPALTGLVATAQAKLAGLAEIDPVPIQWLHLTTLIVGFADEVPAQAIEVMTEQARARLAPVAPIPILLRHVVYDPEAVVLVVEPFGVLDPVLAALRSAAVAAGIQAEADEDVWLPHISIAYSNRTAPAAPVIDALGTRLPDTKVRISSASLVAQTQVGHSWQWRHLAQAQLQGTGRPRQDRA